MTTTLVEHPHPEQEPGSICENALRWIRSNAKAMDLIERFTVSAARRRKRIGMRLIIERVRWEVDVETVGSDFKINNNYAPYIARWLIARNPYLRDVIMLRELRTL